jgi:exodeoxyribonuclease V beta subunit
MQPFEHLETNLNGRKLIESSAGTGKTFAIASLYVRLLIERRLPVHKILVVTFTEAATAELQNRIRRKIRKALQAFESGPPADDDFLVPLVARTSNPADARIALAAALYSFDQAAIFTIHGFCQKALQENAFESASPFNTELMTDQRPLCQQIVEDVWRTNFYRTSAALAKKALMKDLRGELLELMRTSISHPSLKVIPSGLKTDIAGVQDLESNAAQAGTVLAKIWVQDAAPVEAILRTHESLNRRSYGPKSIEKWLREMNVYFTSGFLLPKPDWLEKLSPAGLQKGTNKGGTPPSHAFFNAAGTLLQRLNDLEAAIDRHLLGLKSEFIGYARRELPRRKQQRNVRSFDDLLLDMRTALAGPEGRALAASLRNRFQAALIDEFQDTDPVQYEIFRTIFNDQSSLFLIGDPKQAIYGFRGADIFAYMKAAEDVKDQFTLSKNWRSTSALVTAVNSIFQRRRDPFVFPEIRYLRVDSALSADKTGFELDEEDCPAPLKIWFMPREDESSPVPMNKGPAGRAAPKSVAGEIVNLLHAGIEGRARVEGRPISPWDIAVLVRTNAQAQQVQQELSKRNIPSVVYGTGSVFETEEAVETGRLLMALADPGNEGKVKAALATAILGVSGDALAQFAENDSAWDARLRSFAEYREMWVLDGFVTMARTLLVREGVRKRLLALPNGERRLTNLQHCIELLQNAAVQQKLGVEGLLKWFTVQQQGGTEDAEAQQIRLETDEKALKIITIHKSKGLEFPVVFCPYAWSAMGKPSAQATYHDPGDKTVLVKDLGSEDLAGHQSIEMQEALAEQCRLFYVALTRAKYRCYICWGGIKEAGLSAPAYLFHYPEGKGGPGLAEEVRSHFESLTDKECRKHLEDLARRSQGAIEVADLPALSDVPFLQPAPQSPTLAARVFSGEIARDWGLASFSGWTAGSPHAAELPDRDAVVEAPAVAEEPVISSPPGKSILDFPKGTRAGSCLHAIFEELDFTAAASAPVEELVSEKLDRFGFDPAWQDPACRMVRDVLAVALEGVDGGIVLGQLAGDRRLTEMEFCFPLDRVTPRKLQQVFAAHPAAPVSGGFSDRLGRLGFAPLRGIMKGFIDLVFEWRGRYYLLDWKSNYLGPAVENYGPEALGRSMEGSYYVLQYHIYAVALHRYLEKRLPGYSYERHFGGAFYVFLRGVDPMRGSQFGIYRDLPPADRIMALNILLSADAMGWHK